MDPVLLARIQFAVTAAFHFLFPPMSIGLSLMMVVSEWKYLKTRNPLYEKIAKFWTKVFALTFAVGVATGIVLEFEFGTNWANYARYVGDIFGSPLAAEALFAFFMESTFLGILLFGWNKVGPRTHFTSTIMVALGAILSAFWIIVANSWMQTPAGYHLVEQAGVVRAEITDFWAMVFNPSTIERFTHVISASWITGAFLALSISAYYLIKKRHLDFAKYSLKIALWLAAFSTVLQLVTGHASAIQVTEYQPEKLAAFEAHYETGPGDLYLFGWVDEKNQEVIGLKLPGFLSFLVDFDFTTPITGLNEFAAEDRPPVQVVFQSYHFMFLLGMLMILISFVGLFLLWRKKLFESKWFLKILLPAFILPHIANLLGWMAAEIGRQPWVVYRVLRTSDGVSEVVSAGEIWFSLILFTVIYLILLALFIFLLLRKIKKGPEEVEASAA